MDECVVARLGSKDVDAVQPLFHEVFTQPPWNDDWSDTTQLRRYLLDLLEPSGSLCFGLYKQGVNELADYIHLYKNIPKE